MEQPEYFTTGQVAKTLKISVSTLKRFLQLDPDITKKKFNLKFNSIGWQLFTKENIEEIQGYLIKRR